jgi:hypothetical protein
MTSRRSTAQHAGAARTVATHGAEQPLEQRRVVLAAAVGDALDTACDALRRTAEGSGNDGVLLLWQEPPAGIHVERMWNHDQLDAWQRDRLELLEQQARRRLAAMGLRAQVVCRVVPGGQLVQVLRELHAGQIVVPRPHETDPPAGDDWWNLIQALRHVPGNLVVA